MPSQISIHALLAESDVKVSKNFMDRKDFYPRSPCGERLSIIQLIERGLIFLSTLSLRRATILGRAAAGLRMLFLSTLSLRRATLTPKQNPTQKRISIHALLAESDKLYIDRTAETIVFLSTLSLRRATERGNQH